jgi:beta-glucanase (GH16 family)
MGLLVFVLSKTPDTALTQSGGLAPEGVFGETYYAPFPVEITLDGEFDDWEDVPEVYLGQGVGRPALSFYAAADAEFLYVHANIIDENIISGEHGTDYWNEDSVEFYFNGTGDLSLTSYTDGVAQLTIPAFNRDLPAEEVVLAGVRGATLNAQTITVTTDTGWAVEVAIPLENDVWSIQPQHESEIGFQVHLNAATEVNRDTKLIWSIFDTSDSSYQNPSVFGKLIFYEVSGATTPIVSGEYHFASVLDEDGTVDTFENGIWLGDDNDAPLGYVPQSDEAALSIRQITPTSALAMPDQDDPNNVLAIDSGAFRHVFTDGDRAISQDWSAYDALGFWLYGSNSGGSFSIDILDDATTSTATLADDVEGWQYVILPFAQFESADGGELNTAAITGYGLSPAGDSTYLDDVRLYNVENQSRIMTTDAQPRSAFVLDDSVDWDSREWELIWADEFDADAGATINDESWTCEIGGNGWGNNELEYYTTSTDNVAHDGEGNLTINAIQASPENGSCWYGACAYTSARCITQGKVEFQYGRVEARLQIPYGQGIWPAFWMLGADFRTAGWPNSGEIDILENIGSEPRTVHGTIHGPGYSGASGIGGDYNLDEDFSADFHVYAIEWDPNVIRWYVDGVLYSTVSVNDLRNREWVYNHDFFIIINVAVGGAWPGFPNEETTFPQTMTLDYVRVYQLAH